MRAHLVWRRWGDFLFKGVQLEMGVSDWLLYDNARELGLGSILSFAFPSFLFITQGFLFDGRDVECQII